MTPRLEREQMQRKAFLLKARLLGWIGMSLTWRVVPMFQPGPVIYLATHLPGTGKGAGIHVKKLPQG